MTVWAYKDGVLASDSRISTASAGISGNMQKVIKSGAGWLAGAAGVASDMTQFLRWVEEGREEDDATKLDSLDGVLISPKGKVFYVEADLHPFAVDADFHAGGAGGYVALGAMEMGATAEEAVNIAIKYNSSCGGAVQVVRLKGK